MVCTSEVFSLFSIETPLTHIFTFYIKCPFVFCVTHNKVADLCQFPLLKFHLKTSIVQTVIF